MSKKICIIEDEPALLEMYKVKFEAEGYDVYVAADGIDGLKVIKEKMPDLVLLDLVMPKMNGFKVLDELRSDPKTKDLLIYVFSNLGQSDEIDQGLKEGADGYFVKSNLTPTELARKVKIILAKPEKHNPQPSRSLKLGLNRVA